MSIFPSNKNDNPFTTNGISVEQHKRAYNVGMQIGETNDAINNLLFIVSRMIECGKYEENLTLMLNMYNNINHFL